MSARGAGGSPIPRAKVTAPPAEGLDRARLHDVLDHDGARLVLVTAPPGAGKTTMLAHYAATRRVAWYQADERDGSAEALERHLVAAVCAALDSAVPAETSLVGLLEDGSTRGLAIVVDDAHTLAGTPAEAALARVIALAPPRTTFVLAGRRDPGPALAQLQVGIGAALVTADSLRFRSWEVGELFLRHYGEPLPPEDVAALTRHTEGWAAGLQMFHLATSGKPLTERRRAVAGLWGRGRLLQSYLAATVLHELPAATADFLVWSSALGLVDGETCDALLERTGSAAVLNDLASKQLFTARVDEVAGTYRYHAVLQVQLESMLASRLSPEALRVWYLRAASLQSGAGRTVEALRAYLRAGELGAVHALLQEHGPSIALTGTIPDEVLAIEDDPWLGLARAHRQLASGDLAGAVETFRVVERQAPSPVAMSESARGRRSAEAWVPEAFLPPLTKPESMPWPVRLRYAVRGDLSALADAPVFAKAVGALLRGETASAVELAGQVDAPPHGFQSFAARLIIFAVGTWQGSVPPNALAGLAGEADAYDHPWLARIARAAGGLRGGPARAEAEQAYRECVRDGDEWGALIAGLVVGFAGLLESGAPVAVFAETVERARRLEAGTLEAWARGFHALALARAGLPAAELEARRADSASRSVGLPVARNLALYALASTDSGPAAASEPRPSVSPALHVVRTVPAVSLRCFGGFELRVDGHDVDWQGVRPRALATLRMLACQADQPVHEERLVEALWPGMSAEAGKRNLQVAISALRRTLEPYAPRGRSQLLRRVGMSYVFSLPEGSDADVVTFRSALARWHPLRGGSPGRVRPELRAALAAYAGDLLPEDGPADWVVAEREQARADAARVATALADLELRAGDGIAAAEAGERAVQIDPFRDQAWRLLQSAYQLTGDAAAAALTRRRYAEILDDLGIAAPDPAATA
jgi:DNA-binding SARP family transcriptional activator